MREAPLPSSGAASTRIAALLRAVSGRGGLRGGRPSAGEAAGPEGRPAGDDSTAADPAGVVEIRVHGVGGTPPQDLLGTHVERIVRAGGEGKSAFFRRIGAPGVRPPEAIEGYAWGPLTSGGLTQPLWIFALPFTLLNVAGWMLPSRKRAPRLWGIARLLIIFLGLTLTAAYVLGVSVIVLKQVFVQWGLAGVLTDRGWAVALGSLAVIVLMLATACVTRSRQRAFEHVSSPVAPSHVERAGGTLEAVRSALSEERGLATQDLWSRAAGVKALLDLHFFTAVAVFAALLGYGGEDLSWRDAFVLLVRVQIVAFVALTLVCACMRDLWRREGFRWLGPAVAVSTALGLTAGFFNGAAVVVSRVLTAAATRDRTVVVSGAELDLDLAFGASTLTFLVCGIVVWVRLRRRAKEMGVPNDLPPNTRGPGREPNGIPRGFLPTVRRSRSLAHFGRNVDRLLTFPAIVYWVLLFLLVFREGTAQRLEEITLELGVWRLSLATFLSEFGGWFAAAAVLLLVTFLLRNYFKPNPRRKIGILWDVLTFWPRRFHPLAVRPYSERAVPELQDRILWHLVDESRNVILSTHSQGTVLGVAALAQLSPREDLLRRVALLTYGSPLSQLYGRFFPAYFNTEGFDQLADKLMAGSIEVDAERRPAGWRNFYRLTDYIGQEVKIRADPVRNRAHNQVIDDPPRAPLSAEIFDEEPDPFRSPFVSLSLHSYYNGEKDLKAWLQHLRKHAASAGAGREPRAGSEGSAPSG